MPSLIIRKRRDGTVVLDGSLPDDHSFPSRFLHREIQTGMVEVEIRVKTTDETLVYQATGFEIAEDADGNPVYEANGDPKLNMSGIRATRVSGGRRRRRAEEE